MFVPAPTPAPAKKSKSSDGSHHHHKSSDGKSQPTGAVPNNTQGPPSNASNASSPITAGVSQSNQQGGSSFSNMTTSNQTIETQQQQQQGNSVVVCPPFYVNASSYGVGTPFHSPTTPFQNFSTGGSSQHPTPNTLLPLFHLTASDATIIAIENEPHSSWTAFGLSTGEIYACRHPAEAAVALARGDVSSQQPLVLVGRHPSPATQLCWAPWRLGVSLAACSPAKCVKVFVSSSPTEWNEEIVDVQDCMAIAFSQHNGALFCACTKGRVVLCQRREEGFGVWSETTQLLVTSEETQRSRKTQRDMTAVAISESGTLLAVGDQDGVVRCFDVSPDGKRIQPAPVATILPAGRGVSFVRSLAWAQCNGRSYASLAFATSAELSVYLFANAVHFLTEGTQQSNQNSNNPQQQQQPAGTSSGNTSAGATAQQQQLKKLGQRRIDTFESDLLKLQWNPLGTRLTTSYADGTVKIHSVNVMHRERSLRSLPEDEHGTPSVIAQATPWQDPLIVDIVEVTRAVAPSSSEGILLKSAGR